MPILTSLSIRRRGTTRTDKPSESSTTTTVHTFKHLFTRKTDPSNPRKTSIDKTKTMGNAPSDLNATNAANGSPKPKGIARGSTSDHDSIRSRAMPGAEPPTPVPTPSPSNTPDERSPEPDTKQVQGYDIQDVPHILNPTSTAGDGAGAESSEGPDLEAGLLIPPVSTLDILQLEAVAPPPPREDDVSEPTTLADADAARTPRAELKTEEGLAPLDTSTHAHAHAAEASDATAVALSPRTTGASVWTPGTYVLLNARGGTALDLSGADNTTVIGYPMHGGPNQQWEFIPSGHGYLIRCVRRAHDGHALYLSAAGGVREGAAVVAGAYPVAWCVEQTEDGIRISWPNSDFVFDLAGWGSSEPGTKVQLVAHKPGEGCQHWHYTRCAPAAEHEHDKDEQTVARAFSPPATTETVTISEERDFVTTTRTTTTTVITTVTEVTRVPKALLLQQRQAQRRSITYR